MFSYKCNSKTRKVRVISSIRGRILRVLPEIHPAFQWSTEIQGYRNFTFGACAGPSCGFGNLAHELAHAVEFGAKNFDTRAPDGYFIFHVPSVEIAGVVCREPSTNQASLRECRVGGIEKRILREAGYHIDDALFAQYYCELIKYLPDWYCMEPSMVAPTIEQSYAEWPIERIRSELSAWFDKTHQANLAMEH